MLPNTIRQTNQLSMAHLSPRETEIMELLAEGLLYKEVAERLDLTLGTVKQYAHGIYQKLGAQNRTEAINNFFGNNHNSKNT